MPRRLACANARNALRAATAIGPKNGCRAPRSRRCCSCASHRSGYATPQGFLFLVLEHVYLDSARHQIREDRLIDRGIDLHDGQLERFAAVGSPLERLEQLERLDQVDKALASLSRQQQQLFELRFIEELPYADIASQLGIAPPLVRKRVQLLRSRLSADFFAGDVSQDRRSRVHS